MYRVQVNRVCRVCRLYRGYSVHWALGFRVLGSGALGLWVWGFRVKGLEGLAFRDRNIMNFAAEPSGHEMESDMQSQVIGRLV